MESPSPARDGGVWGRRVDDRWTGLWEMGRVLWLGGGRPVGVLWTFLRSRHGPVPGPMPFRCNLQGLHVASLDLGSNSFHLLVGRRGWDGRIEKVGSKKATRRLGASVAEYGLIPPGPFEQALGTLSEMAALARTYRAHRFAAVGTSALRDATNGDDFVHEALTRHGVRVEILSGEDEGRFAYEGARHQLAELPHRVAVLDLGGSSLEVAIGDGRSCFFVESLPLGFLRLMRKLEAPGPIDRRLARKVSEHVRSCLAPIVERVRGFAPQAWLLSGGTARGLRALNVERDGVASTSTLVSLANELSPLPSARLESTGVDAGRAPTIGLGLLVYAQALDFFGVDEISISPGGLREGIVLRELRASRKSGNRPGAAWTRPA